MVYDLVDHANPDKEKCEENYNLHCYRKTLPGANSPIISTADPDMHMMYILKHLISSLCLSIRLMVVYITEIKLGMQNMLQRGP